MSIHSHARCNNCEQILWPKDDRYGFDEYEVLEAGWIELRRFSPQALVELEGDEEDLPDPDQSTFCSPRCLAVWASMFTSVRGVAGSAVEEGE